MRRFEIQTSSNEKESEWIEVFRWYREGGASILRTIFLFLPFSFSSLICFLVFLRFSGSAPIRFFVGRDDESRATAGVLSPPNKFVLGSDSVSR